MGIASPVPILADLISAHNMIGSWHHTVVCLSVCLCIVAKPYIVQQVSEEVNRKCSPEHILQLSSPQTSHPQSVHILPIYYTFFFNHVTIVYVATKSFGDGRVLSSW